MPILELENVGYSYDKSTKVLEKINYSFKRGSLCQRWTLRVRENYPAVGIGRSDRG